MNGSAGFGGEARSGFRCAPSGLRLPSGQVDATRPPGRGDDSRSIPQSAERSIDQRVPEEGTCGGLNAGRQKDIVDRLHHG